MIEIECNSNELVTVYKDGALFKVDNGDVYMLVQTDANVYKLISLKSGNRVSSGYINILLHDLTLANISKLCNNRLTPVHKARLLI